MIFVIRVVRRGGIDRQAYRRVTCSRRRECMPRPHPRTKGRSMRPRAGNDPRNMTVKLLSGRDGPEPDDETISLAVDQIAVTLPTLRGFGTALSTLERSTSIDLAVAYDPYCIRNAGAALDDNQLNFDLKRLGFARGRPGIGCPAAVHLERCAAPARVVVVDSPQMTMLGGLGMLTIVASAQQLVESIATGRLDWQTPEIIQIILSGRLTAAVVARDVSLELVRLGLRELVQSVIAARQAQVVLEFTGPGTRGLSVSERAMLCSMAPSVGAAAAIAACDEKTELFLRDQRRSKANRQLSPDPGAPCAEVLCLDLSTVVPLVALHAQGIVPVAEVAGSPIREVIIGGECSATLRDLLTAAAWFKTKRTAADVDVMIVPATRQVFECIANNGTLTQLLSVGVRLLEPDARLLEGHWHPPPCDGISLRSFAQSGNAATGPINWALGSVDTLSMSAIAGTLQDPRATRKSQRVTSPRQLPIDDSLLFDRRPANSTTLAPPKPTSDSFSTNAPIPKTYADGALGKRVLGERQAWS